MSQGGRKNSSTSIMLTLIPSHDLPSDVVVSIKDNFPTDTRYRFCILIARDFISLFLSPPLPPSPLSFSPHPLSSLLLLSLHPFLSLCDIAPRLSSVEVSTLLPFPQKEWCCAFEDGRSRQDTRRSPPSHYFGNSRQVPQWGKLRKQSKPRHPLTKPSLPCSHTHADATHTIRLKF